LKNWPSCGEPLRRNRDEIIRLKAGRGGKHARTQTQWDGQGDNEPKAPSAGRRAAASRRKT